MSAAERLGHRLVGVAVIVGLLAIVSGVLS